MTGVLYNRVYLLIPAFGYLPCDPVEPGGNAFCMLAWVWEGSKNLLTIMPCVSLFIPLGQRESLMPIAGWSKPPVHKESHEEPYPDFKASPSSKDSGSSFQDWTLPPCFPEFDSVLT